MQWRTTCRLPPVSPRNRSRTFTASTAPIAPSPSWSNRECVSDLSHRRWLQRALESTWSKPGHRRGQHFSSPAASSACRFPRRARTAPPTLGPLMQHGGHHRHLRCCSPDRARARTHLSSRREKTAVIAGRFLHKRLPVLPRADPSCSSARGLAQRDDGAASGHRNVDRRGRAGSSPERLERLTGLLRHSAKAVRDRQASSQGQPKPCDAVLLNGAAPLASGPASPTVSPRDHRQLLLPLPARGTRRR